MRWREVRPKEGWWAIWLGLGIVLVAYLFFANGSSICWLTVTPAKWSTFAQLGAHFSTSHSRYIAQFIFRIAAVSVAPSAFGYKAREFIPTFAFLYLLSVVPAWRSEPWRQPR